MWHHFCQYIDSDYSIYAYIRCCNFSALTFSCEILREKQDFWFLVIEWPKTLNIFSKQRQKHSRFNGKMQKIVDISSIYIYFCYTDDPWAPLARNFPYCFIRMYIEENFLLRHVGGTAEATPLGDVRKQITSTALSYQQKRTISPSTSKPTTFVKIQQQMNQKNQIPQEWTNKNLQ